MTIDKFITKLVSMYDKPISGTKILCKFYLQAATVSFELHDSRKICFTRDSMVFDSSVYYWGDEKENAKIIKDIIKVAKEHWRKETEFSEILAEIKKVGKENNG